MGIEALIGAGADLLSGAADAIGSVISDLGTEFASAAAPTDLPVFQAANPLDFGGYEAVGSFAGYDAWVEAFDKGSIVGSASPVTYGFDVLTPTELFGTISPVSDFPGLTRSLSDSVPLSSIKDVASTVQKDFGRFVSDAQAGLVAYQKVAPLVNLASSALGIQNPVNAILAPVSQAVGIAGAAAGVAGAVSTGDIRSLATNPAVINAVYSVAGSGLAPVAQGIGAGVSLYNTVNALGSTVNPVLQPGALVATNGIVGGTSWVPRELNDEEAAALERNLDPRLINRLVDPETNQPLTYNTALISRDELNLTINDYNTEIANSERAIQSNNANITAIEAELADGNLSDDRRSELEAALQASYENNAIQQNIRDSNLAGLSTAVSSLAADQEIINSTNNSLTQSPGAITTSTYQDSVFAALTAAGLIPSVSNINRTPTNVEVGFIAEQPPNAAPDPGTGVGVQARNLVQEARNQQTLRNLTNTKAQSSDWRVRLRLAPNSTYLYNAFQPGLLAPLSAKEGTDGVVFPYTPSIDTAYKANYESYDLTHSNYRGYFYKNSYVDAVNIRAQFTAQDTVEANYLLAVIHFFRSATKMFYGQDSQRGSPPPLVYLSGLGGFQFNEHPCVISQFNYQLPSDVDYIRAQTFNRNGTDLLANRTRTSIPGNPLSFGINRLLNNALTQGALDTRPTQDNLPLGTPTYVPTKMEMSISLLPIQTRQQVSKQFSLRAFANGNLLQGGFW